jgi:twitching motility protein PilT
VRGAADPGQAAMELDLLLKDASERGASDVHLKLRQPPVVRVDGALEPLDGWDALTEMDLAGALQAVVDSSPARLGRLEDGELDLAYSTEGLPRFRVNCFRQRGAVSLAFRVIPDRAPTFTELNLPAGVVRLAHDQRGLILVTGASGVGKTTTLAAMIDEINRTRRQHIVTVEDPIEFIHHDRSCIVNQREVGIDTVSFHTALRSVLRQDPDVILIGELRDVETAETALQAAETGHLVLSTMHTIDAAETIGRLIEFFPGGKQAQVRSILAGVLRGVISQRLLPRTDGGRIPAVEVMVMNARIDELIREHRTQELEAAIEEGSFHEMQSFQQSLIGLVLAGEVEAELAANASTNKHDFLIELEHALKRQKAEEKGWVDPRSEQARAGIIR